MTTHYIAVSNLKGGTGKTTIAAMLSYSLAQLGKKVVLIDLDPQASATSIFFKKFQFRKHMGRYIGVLGRREMELYKPMGLNNPNLKIFPSDTIIFSETWTLAYTLPDPELIARWLRQEPALHQYNFVIIDCPPDPMFARIGVKASNWIIIPTDLTPLSIHGTKEFIQRIYKYEVLQASHDIKLLGIVLNKVRLKRNQPTKRIRRIKTELVKFIKEIVRDEPQLRKYIYYEPIFNTMIPIRESLLSDIVVFGRKVRKNKVPVIYRNMPIFRSLAEEVIQRIDYFRGIII